MYVIKEYFYKTRAKEKKIKIHEKSGALQGVHASSKVKHGIYITYMLSFMENLEYRATS